MRRAHWLKGNPVTKIPKWHICVATTLKDSTDKSCDKQLDRAVIRVGRWEKGRWHEDGCGIYPNTASFWSAMAGHVSTMPRAWIWLLDPAQDCPALRLTQRVESGELRRKWWVWSDPPMIVVGTLYGRAVQIMGVSNWLDPKRALWHPESDHNDRTTLKTDFNTQFDMPIYWQGYRCSRLVSSILQFVHREDLGHLRSTVGGQAMQSYRHLHLGENKILVDDNAAALALERSCATGFPVRASVQGRIPDDVWVVDVNALYPWVMHAYSYPRKRIYHGRCDGVSGLKNALGKWFCVARVSGYDGQRHYLARRKEGCVYVSTLENDALCGPDLDSAVSRNAVHEVHEVACYDSAPLFKEWGLWAWELRQAYKRSGDKIGELLAKSLSVALWGKFAGTLGKWADPIWPASPPTQYGRWAAVDPDGNPVEMRTIAGITEQLDGDDEPDISCPAISAFVASYARAFMQGLRAIAGENYVLYQCADALHVTELGYRRLLNSGLVEPAAFGKLKVAGPFTDAYYYRPNIYRIGGVWTHAGRPVDAVEVRPGCFEWSSPARLSQSVYAPMTGAVRMIHHGTSLQNAADVPQSAPRKRNASGKRS